MPTPHHTCTQPRTLEQRTPRVHTTLDPRTTHAGPTHTLDPKPNLPTANRPLPTAHFRQAVGQCDSTARTPASSPPPAPHCPSSAGGGAATRWHAPPARRRGAGGVHTCPLPTPHCPSLAGGGV
ncbi:hypothetical protein DXG01_014768, partial [Tephrocybe rancida]